MTTTGLVLAQGSAGLWAVVALAVLGGVAVWARRFLPTERWRREQLRVHRELAARNGLDGDETEWLWQLISNTKLERPSVVFVRPTLFDERVVAVGAVPSLAARVRAKLFGSLAPIPTPTP